MYGRLRVIALAPVFEECAKIGPVVARMPRDVVDEVVIIDDGSTDGSGDVARRLGASVLAMGRRSGVGAALRAGYAHALERGFDVAVVLAGNGKDAPGEIPRLLEPIARGKADFVQGSRFLRRPPALGPMPFYRRVATRIHPLLFSLLVRRVSESTNGFRAIHRRVLADPRIRLAPAWLDGYALEPYLFIRAAQLGYRLAEVAVSKRYPPRRVGQTKMVPGRDWWAILAPLVLVALGFRE